jgi:hypothetical protein
MSNHHIELNISALQKHPLKLNEKTLFTHGEGLQLAG